MPAMNMPLMTNATDDTLLMTNATDDTLLMTNATDDTTNDTCP